MPIYEYRCRSCGTVFEKLVFGDGASLECEACHGTNVDKLLSTFAVGRNAAPEPGPCGACGAAQRGMCGLQD